MNDTKKDPSIRRRRRRIALTISLIVHICLITVFIAWRVQWLQSGDDGNTPAIGASGGGDGGDGGDGTGTLESDAPESPTIPADLLQANIDKAIAKSATLGEDEKLDKLDELADKLGSTTSDKTIDELADRFRAWMGTPPRATEPAEQPVEGDFDSNTAQFHEVARTEGPDGQWQYRSILVDAQGRTMEVDLGPEEGRVAYETMQRLKRSPLAEKLYRQITMPLLDKILKAREDLGKGARESGTGQPSPEPNGDGTKPDSSS